MWMRVTMLAAVMVALSASVLEAQVAERPRVTFEARVGYDHPLRDLGRTGILRGAATPAGYLAFETIDPGAVFGAGLSARVADPVSVRLLADYSGEREARGQWFCEAFSPCPAVLQIVDGRVRRWSVGVDLQLHLPPAPWGVEPTIFAGVASRGTRIRWDVPNPQVPIPTAYDKTEIVFRPGVGLTRAVGAFSLFVEADASVGGAGDDRPLFIEGTVPPDTLTSPETQVDLGLTVGARFRVR